MKIQRTFLVLIAAIMLPALAQAQALGRDGKPILDDPNATPGASNCYSTHQGVGCDNAACSADVISIDSFCGSIGWDGICVNEAKALCPVDGGTEARATFAVQKAFADGNSVTKAVAEIDCFTGLPLFQSQEIKNGQKVTFIVESFEDEKLDCTVTEQALAGYTASYKKGAALIETGGFSPSSASGCTFLTVGWEQNWSCLITNTPDVVPVVVTKDWEVEGAGGNQLDPTYSLELKCDNPIEGGDACGGNTYCYNLTGYYGSDTEDTSYTAYVVPDWAGGTKCWVEESVYDTSIEVDDDDCDVQGDILVKIAGTGGDNACTIVNTVFYEGIPTLSQYGMAIMALMMLAVGFVGFRRFV